MIFESIITYLIQNLIIPLLPIFIFGNLLNMSYSGQVVTIMNVFLENNWCNFRASCFLVSASIYNCRNIAKKNPFTMLKLMLPAYFTALGTQSSSGYNSCNNCASKENWCSLMKLPISLCRCVQQFTYLVRC